MQKFLFPEYPLQAFWKFYHLEDISVIDLRLRFREHEITIINVNSCYKELNNYFISKVYSDPDQAFKMVLLTKIMIG